MIMRRIAVFVLFTALHSAAWAGSEAKVRGWARGQNPHTVEVFDANGVPRGLKDLSDVDVTGRRHWDPSTGLVQLPGPQWVESRRLDLIFCETSNASFNPQSTSRPAGAKTYGSGGPCDAK